MLTKPRASLRLGSIRQPLDRAAPAGCGCNVYGVHPRPGGNGATRERKNLRPGAGGLQWGPLTHLETRAAPGGT